MHVTRRTTCRGCGCASLVPAIDLGEQYLQGSFFKTGIEAPLRKVPMRLLRCDPNTYENACGLLQTEFTVPPEMMYQQYWYRSGTNQTMRDHLRDIATDCLRMSTAANRVLDIGCNDGTLLRCFPTTLERWGVDPSNITAELAGATDLHIVNDFFPSPMFAARRGDRLFDVVTAIAMFYDLESPTSFLQSVADVLSPEGVFVFEMSHLPAMLATNSYDTICHEHLEYYSFAVIEKLLTRVQLRAVSVSENAINGGSIRVAAMHARSSVTADASVRAMRVREFELKLETAEPYVDFQKRADLHRKDLLALLQKLRGAGKRIHLYGASTKGNTLLQWCGIDHTLIDMAADRNPAKDGARTPGTNIPIVTEEKSRAVNPDYYLVLPWHFKEEFISRERALRDRGTKFIFPLPQIEVL